MFSRVIGSVLIGAFIAHAAFWSLLAWGWFSAELRTRGILIAIAFWIGGYFALPLVPQGDVLFLSFVAALDIVLVLVIFKGDVLIT
jgi:hypothetical protein